ncbi:MAG: CobQ/CobB/MinD/ParA nucleotide binding domain protein [Methanosaeta sp. PtaB.Bin018]|jgi:CO dehydrogenase maturation factor|nr:AAA family ATPase [Methanothrix sp.]OPX75882.1 MAG: CobQ/CobB/MinD/ParA nucleotide binding domain protein [Methanosaeta sp. PtaB.Bin018]OPY43162.1 MAG: CobQ/CobB/MinD/ParA nucleotide binding domain protein [Methanosaeta sp. PtaU1.Bin016]
MKILICGKGGSGKSTISALMAKEIAKRENEVLVVDTDESNFGLYKQLGFLQPKDFMESLGGKKALSEKMMKFFRSERREGLKILDEFSIKDIPQELVVGGDGIKLVAIGKIHSFGEGCACPMGALAREFLEKLRTDGEHVIVDTDAGIEHFGRGVEAGCDKIVVVVDPSFESVQLSAKISEMCQKIGKPVFFILNRMDENSSELLELVDKNKVIGILPFDREVFKACLKGVEVPQIPEMEKITDKLLAA